MCVCVYIYIYIYIYITYTYTTVWKGSKYWVFSGPDSPVFGLNMEIYVLNLRTQSKYGKIRTRKSSAFGQFLHRLHKYTYTYTYNHTYTNTHILHKHTHIHICKTVCNLFRDSQHPDPASRGNQLVECQ